MRPANILKLNRILSSLGSVLVAFSGGTDSGLLLKKAVDLLGRKKVLAVTAESETYPAHEIKAAVKFCRKYRVRQIIIRTNEINNPSFTSNPKDRCYHCKLELFSKLNELAKKAGLNYVCDGSNYDDLSDFRPGSKAKNELGVRSPLQEAGFTKNDVRELSRKLKLPTWNKPSLACLSSRLPYGTPITLPILKQINQAENYLRKLGFKQIRVRHHHNLARIEVEPKALSKALKFSSRIAKEFKKLGYAYTTLDLTGYRTGAMNEVI